MKAHTHVINILNLIAPNPIPQLTAGWTGHNHRTAPDMALSGQMRKIRSSLQLQPRSQVVVPCCSRGWYKFIFSKVSHNMGKPILYANDFSPAVRSVLLVARAINLELEIRYIFGEIKNDLNIYSSSNNLVLIYVILDRLTWWPASIWNQISWRFDEHIKLYNYI